MSTGDVPLMGTTPLVVSGVYVPDVVIVVAVANCDIGVPFAVRYTPIEQGQPVMLLIDTVPVYVARTNWFAPAIAPPGRPGVIEMVPTVVCAWPVTNVEKSPADTRPRPRCMKAAICSRVTFDAGQ